MKRIWAPWRIKYITAKKEKRCIFCVTKDRSCDKDRYILARSRYSFSILNKYPYNNGHAMVAPYRHASDLNNLTQAELLDLMHLLNATKSLISKVLRPDGFNIGINLGKAAGAGIEGHVHIHIVPRWAADTNFMSMCADTKIISDSLDSLYKRLKNVDKG